MIIQEIGQEMKKFRKKNNYTQAQLAELLGVTKQSISNYETGKSQPNLSIVIHFSIISDMSVEEIIFFHKNKGLLREPEFLDIIEEFRAVCELDYSKNKQLSIHSESFDKFSNDIRKKFYSTD